MFIQSSPIIAPAPQDRPASAAAPFWQLASFGTDCSWDEAVATASPPQKFAADGEIFSEGDTATHCYRVVNGIVRICKFFDDGRRQVHAFYVAGDFFGIEPGNEYRYSAEAVTACTIAGYRRKDVEQVVSDNAGLFQGFLGMALRDLSRAQEHNVMLGRKNAHERVATFLKEWLLHSSNGATVMLAMTRQDIADYLGLTMETVSRTLSQMERDGVIEIVTPREISVKDRAAFKRLLC